MLTAAVLLVIFLFFYRKKYTYNPYDVKYSHSSYYDCTFSGPEKCTDRIRGVIRQMAGYGLLVPAASLSAQPGQKDRHLCADLGGSCGSHFRKPVRPLLDPVL